MASTELYYNLLSSNDDGEKTSTGKRSSYFRCNINLEMPTYFKLNAKWIPPRSPYNLIQEDLYHDPWKMLIATICLQKTTGQCVKKTLMDFFSQYSSPQHLILAESSEVAKVLLPLGLQEKKAKIILRFTNEYLTKDWKYPIELYGIGKYGNDSYRIFCISEWKNVRPKDHMLKKYHQWLEDFHVGPDLPRFY